MGLKMKRRAKGAGGTVLRDADFPTKATAQGVRKYGGKKGRK